MIASGTDRQTYVHHPGADNGGVKLLINLVLCFDLPVKKMSLLPADAHIPSASTDFVDHGSGLAADFFLLHEVALLSK